MSAFTSSSRTQSGASLASAPRTRWSVWSSLKTQSPANDAAPGTTASVYGRSAASVCARTSSTVFSEVTMTAPPSCVGFQIGWRPYQAQDSTPFTSVSSTATTTSTTLGSNFAMDDSSSMSSAATTAKYFAGTPLRSGESP